MARFPRHIQPTKRDGDNLGFYLLLQSVVTHHLRRATPLDITQQWKNNDHGYHDMTQVTQDNLQEIKELIKAQNQTIGRLEQKFEEKTDKLAEKIGDLEKGQIKLEAKLEAWKPSIDKIPDLTEKIGELKNWRSIALIIISGVITTLFWFFLEMGNFDILSHLKERDS